MIVNVPKPAMVNVNAPDVNHDYDGAAAGWQAEAAADEGGVLFLKAGTQ
jgi:hypothetical protein